MNPEFQSPHERKKETKLARLRRLISHRAIDVPESLTGDARRLYIDVASGKATMIHTSEMAPIDGERVAHLRPPLPSSIGEHDD